MKTDKSETRPSAGRPRIPPFETNRSPCHVDDKYPLAWRIDMNDQNFSVLPTIQTIYHSILFYTKYNTYFAQLIPTSTLQDS